MRYVLAPVGSEGDVRPMVALAKGLQARGHDVLLAAAPDFEALAQSHGIEFKSVGSSIRPLAQATSGRVNGRTFSGMRVMLDWCRLAIREQFEQLVPLLEGADRIVAGGLQFAAGSVAERRHIPYRHVVHVPIVLPSRFHPPATIPWVNLPHALNRLLWAVSGWGMNATLRPMVNQYRAGLGLGGIGDCSELFSRRMLVAIDPELAPLPPDVRSDTTQTSYFRLDDEASLSSEVESFLDAGAAPVFIGFGSMGDDNPHATSRILSEAIRNVGCRAIVAKGWAELDSDLDPSRVLVVGHVPHSLLFPRVSAVVHHGGAGTTWGAARAGVPQVVVPHLLDQYFWADRLRRIGVSGNAIPRRELSSENLVRSLREAMDPSRKVALSRLAGALASRDGLSETLDLL